MRQLKKDLSAWRKPTHAESYHVTRQKGTEPALHGEYETPNRGHLQMCLLRSAGFSLETKIPSGSGWAQLLRSRCRRSRGNRNDLSHGMKRVEGSAASRCTPWTWSLTTAQTPQASLLHQFGPLDLDED